MLDHFVRSLQPSALQTNWVAQVSRSISKWYQVGEQRLGPLGGLTGRYSYPIGNNWICTRISCWITSYARYSLARCKQTGWRKSPGPLASGIKWGSNG